MTWTHFAKSDLSSASENSICVKSLTLFFFWASHSNKTGTVSGLFFMFDVSRSLLPRALALALAAPCGTMSTGLEPPTGGADAPVSKPSQMFKSCWSCRLISGGGLILSGAYVFHAARKVMRQGGPTSMGTVAQITFAASKSISFLTVCCIRSLLMNKCALVFKVWLPGG